MCIRDRYIDGSDGNNNDQVVVVANFSSSDRTVYNVPFLSAGNWYNITDPGNDLFTNDGNYGEYFISAKTAMVYSNHEWQLGISDKQLYPAEFQTVSLYPNPFNGRVQIHFSVPGLTSGVITIYDLGGRLIESFDKVQYNKGDHYIVWDASTQKGRPLASGIYLVSFETGLGSINKKILYLK